MKKLKMTDRILVRLTIAEWKLICRMKDKK